MLSLTLFIYRPETLKVSTDRFLNGLKRFSSKSPDNSIHSFKVYYHNLDIVTFNSILSHRLDSVISVGIHVDDMKPRPDEIKDKLSYYRINRLQGE